MTQLCSDDLLRYLYQESSPSERKAVEKRLFGAENAETESFYQMVQLKSDLDKLVSAEPRRSVVDRIMAYSRRSARKEKVKVG